MTPSPPSRSNPRIPRSKKVKISSPPENVQIQYKVKLPDTHGTMTVPRHTPLPEITQLSPIRSLHASFQGDIDVSPAHSACSNTEVTISTSLTGIAAQIQENVTAALVAEYNDTLERRIEERIKENNKVFQSSLENVQQSANARIDSRVSSLEERASNLEDWKISGFRGSSFEEYARRLEKKNAFINRQSQYASMRAIEDWCIDRMRRVLGKTADGMNNSAVINLFLQKYELPFSFNTAHLSALYHSRDRKTANSLIHITPEDTEEVSLMWESLTDSLDNADVIKYQALMEFGSGLITCKYRGD